MVIVYGPKPGTEVTFSLDVSPPSSIPDGKGGQLVLSPKEGVDGASLDVTVRVPSEADKRALDHHFDGAKISLEGARLVVTTASAKHNAWRADAIRTFVVKVDGLIGADPVTHERTAYQTPDEVLAFADDDVLNALANTLMDRVRLSEVLRKNSKGRSGSSTAALPPVDGTAANAVVTVSAQTGSVIAPPTESST